MFIKFTTMDIQKRGLLSFTKRRLEPQRVYIAEAETPDRAAELGEIFRKDNPHTDKEQLDLYGNTIFGMGKEAMAWLRKLQQIALEKTLAKYGNLGWHAPEGGISSLRFVGLDYPQEVAEDAVAAVREYIAAHPRPREE